jgi:hypothetical protein
MAAHIPVVTPNTLQAEQSRKRREEEPQRKQQQRTSSNPSKLKRVNTTTTGTSTSANGWRQHPQLLVNNIGLWLSTPNLENVQEGIALRSRVHSYFSHTPNSHSAKLRRSQYLTSSGSSPKIPPELLDSTPIINMEE